MSFRNGPFLMGYVNFQWKFNVWVATKPTSSSIHLWEVRGFRFHKPQAPKVAKKRNKIPWSTGEQVGQNMKKKHRKTYEISSCLDVWFFGGQNAFLSLFHMAITLPETSSLPLKMAFFIGIGSSPNDKRWCQCMEQPNIYVVLARKDEVFVAINIVHVAVCYMHGWVFKAKAIRHHRWCPNPNFRQTVIQNPTFTVRGTIHHPAKK